ncbi:hypothetical protein [Flavobacterium sp. KJJ]|uniref:hypothetical protein n=1 Tax=Flavobacterium sp. KJJ TaxID=1270193 RepID=UPI000493AD13|nr:hypothetical protein [Flavobacterium sp. KJJ]
MIKKIVLRITILIIIIFGFIAFGLYLIEIDDHYGDLQEIYFETKSGDIIINKQTKEFGVIAKNWKRADIITKENDTLDLNEIIYKNQEESKYEVFRSEQKFIIGELNYKKILELKRRNVLETIIKN